VDGAELAAVPAVEVAAARSLQLCPRPGLLMGANVMEPPTLLLDAWEDLWEEVHEVAARIDQRVQHALEVPAMQPAPLSVLVVEDDRDTAKTTAMVLEMFGHRVRVAHDGPAAIDAVRAEQPDAVVVDISMPGMDGYELAERLHSLVIKNPLLVALSGYACDPERSKAAGFSFHFLKPVDPDILRDLLRARAALRDVMA
jgi:CheY-like chemotaxis protein